MPSGSNQPFMLPPKYGKKKSPLAPQVRCLVSANNSGGAGHYSATSVINPLLIIPSTHLAPMPGLSSLESLPNLTRTDLLSGQQLDGAFGTHSA